LRHRIADGRVRIGSLRADYQDGGNYNHCNQNKQKPVFDEGLALRVPKSFSQTEIPKAPGFHSHLPAYAYNNEANHTINISERFIFSSFPLKNHHFPCFHCTALQVFVKKNSEYFLYTRDERIL
jgi:hypothetical protein